MFSSVKIVVGNNFCRKFYQISSIIYNRQKILTDEKFNDIVLGHFQSIYNWGIYGYLCGTLFCYTDARFGVIILKSKGLMAIE